MNKLLYGLKEDTNYGYTQNGGIKHNTTNSKLLDLFAMGAAMRNRKDNDCILLFKEAYEENSVYALKCLFYIRDIIEGQGERRFFRVCINWLADYDLDAILRNINKIPLYGRWDDLYALVDTPAENAAFSLIKNQLKLDTTTKVCSLCAKWLHSENCSSRESRRLGEITRKYLNMSHREYRKMLSYLRSKINIVEKLMSENRWEEIEFDKLPSVAGIRYRNAFARNDIIKERYKRFVADKKTKVNAAALYPYQVVDKAIHTGSYTERSVINKYWDNLTDYFNGCQLNALCMVDTSGSMFGTPINVAISLGLYCAERAKGPFFNHYISFSHQPQLIECSGIDFVDKVKRIYNNILVENTNIEAAFDMILNSALQHHVPQKDLPEYILIISDMEFDDAIYAKTWDKNTTMEKIMKKWEYFGYTCPKLIFWNVDAKQSNIPMIGSTISYISGFSPSIFSTIISGKTGAELMMEKLNSDRYSSIF